MTTTRKPLLTPKQKVLRRHPDAECHESVDKYFSIATPVNAPNPWFYLTGWFRTPAQAWADAAKNMGRGR